MSAVTVSKPVATEVAAPIAKEDMVMEPVATEQAEEKSRIKIMCAEVVELVDAHA